MRLVPGKKILCALQQEFDEREPLMWRKIQRRAGAEQGEAACSFIANLNRHLSATLAMTE